MKDRIQSLDILKGLAIVLVLIGHYYHPKLILYIIWSFHMPLFVIMSGYFFRELNPNQIKQQITKILKSYFVPYLVIVIIMMTYKILVYTIKILCFKKNMGFTFWELIVSWIYGVIFAVGIDINVGKITVPNVGAAWFLAALIVGETIVAFTYIFKSERIKLMILIAITIGMSLLKRLIIMPFQLEVGGGFTLWLWIGMQIKKKSNNHIIKDILKPSGCIIKMTVCALWTLCIMFELFTGIPFDISDLSFRLYGFGWIGAILGSLVLYYMAEFLEKASSDKLNHYLIYFGRNTLWILGVHSMDMVCFTPLWQRIPFNDFMLMIVRIVFVLALSFLAKKVWDISKKILVIKLT